MPVKPVGAYEVDHRSVAGLGLNKILVGQGVGVDPIEEDKAAGAGLAIYGDGSDGNGSFETGTVGTPVSTDLTRDMFYNDLTIGQYDTVVTKGYRIFVRGTLTNNGIIDNSGSDGVTGTGGAAVASSFLGGSGVGGTPTHANPGGGGGGGGVLVIAARIIVNSGIIRANGGKGGNGQDGGWDDNGVAGGNTDPSMGANGGVGGDADGQTGGVGGTVTVPPANAGGFRSLPRVVLLRYLTFAAPPVHHRVLGGGGGGSGAESYNVGADTATGGGGGGGGGLVVIVYGSATWGTEQAVGGIGGSGFSGTGTGENGSDGSAGIVIKIANV